MVPGGGGVGESQRMRTATWHSEHSKIEATSSLFPDEEIAELETTQSIAKQNKDLI